MAGGTNRIEVLQHIQDEMLNYSIKVGNFTILTAGCIPFQYTLNIMQDKNEIRKRYWRANIKYLVILLIIWFVVSYGAGIIWADTLNQFRLGGFKLGFWFAQQGSIYFFVVLIYVYVILMNNLDRKFDVHD